MKSLIPETPHTALPLETDANFVFGIHPPDVFIRVTSWVEAVRCFSQPSNVWHNTKVLLALKHGAETSCNEYEIDHDRSMELCQRSFKESAKSQQKTSKTLKIVRVWRLKCTSQSLVCLEQHTEYLPNAAQRWKISASASSHINQFSQPCRPHNRPVKRTTKATASLHLWYRFFDMFFWSWRSESNESVFDFRSHI